MADLRFTENQQNCINANEQCLLVSAAAGSGKTAVLTERVIRLLTGDNPIDADRLVIVTYTVAAADEMRRRIRLKLSELIELDPTNQLLLSQQLLLSKAKISTIHSLCTDIIKNNFQRLGLSSNFRIAESVELGLIKRDSVDEVLEKAYEAASPDFLALVEDWRKRNDNPLAELIMSVYGFIRSFAFPKRFLKHTLEVYQRSASYTFEESIWYDDIKKHVADALEYAIRFLNKGLDEMQADPAVAEKYQEAFISDLEQFNRIIELLKADSWDTAVLCADNTKVCKAKLKAVSKYEDKAFLEGIKSHRASAYKILTRLSEKYLCCDNQSFSDDITLLIPRIKTLFSLVEQVYDLIEQKKLKKSILDFDDLEHLTVSLLVDTTESGYKKSDTAAALSNEIDEIMIDECQDINEVQDLIFRMLSRSEENLFMVGDVKQSIYRFRKAMPSLFINRKNTFKRYSPDGQTGESGSLIILEKNFRSRADICNTVNYIFSQIMSTEIGDIEYNEDEHLVPAASYLPIPYVQSELHIVDFTAIKNSDDDKARIQIEAQHIGMEINKMVSSGYPVQDKDGTLRACSYRDFAILLRAKKGKAAVIEQELKEMNIPSFADSTEGYFNEYEVAVIVNLLRVIDNPLLDVPILSVMMSPMFGFDADAITEIRLCNKGKSKTQPMYLCVVYCAQNGSQRCRHFIDTIAKFRTKSVTVNVDELIQEIYDVTDYISLSYAAGNGEQKDANLRLLLSYAKQYERIGSYGLSGFLRYIDRIIETKQDFICANVNSEYTDTVKIMSIHSSKGLEFPICFVADCAKKFNRTDLNQEYQFNSLLGYGMKIKQREQLKSYSNLPFEAIKLKTEKEAISEEMRALYVALTRAREKLIMVITMENPSDSIAKLCSIPDRSAKAPSYAVYSASSYAEWIIQSVIRHPNMSNLREYACLDNIPLLPASFDISCSIITPSSEENNSSLPIEQPAAPDDKIVDRLSRCFSYKYQYDVMTKIPAKLTATQIAKAQQKTAVKLDTSPIFMRDSFSADSLTPAQRGTALHSFMQFADFENAKHDIKAELARLVKHGFITQIQAQSIDIDKVHNYLNSELHKRMCSAYKIYREYKFLYFISAADINSAAEDKSEEILMQGIADCIFFEKDGIVIVDYKTDYTDDVELLADRYRGQLSVYKQAIEQTFMSTDRIPVKECLIYSLHMQRSIQIDV